MKRWPCIFLALLLALSLSACGGAPDEQNTSVQTETPDLLTVADSAAALASADDAGDDVPEESVVPVRTPDPVPDAAEAEDGDLSGMGELPVLSDAPESGSGVTEDGSYTGREDVALYLHLYGHLPGNFITKREARELGWNGGSLEPYAPGACIGGDYFGNYEGALPAGHSYHECDIDTLGANSRGAKRLVFSDDGLIFYTDDHYNTFTLLYGDE